MLRVSCDGSDIADVKWGNGGTILAPNERTDLIHLSRPALPPSLLMKCMFICKRLRESRLLADAELSSHNLFYIDLFFRVLRRNRTPTRSPARRARALLSAHSGIWLNTCMQHETSEVHVWAGEPLFSIQRLPRLN